MAYSCKVAPFDGIFFSFFLIMNFFFVNKSVSRRRTDSTKYRPNYNSHK
jgi:hypothetical protein